MTVSGEELTLKGEYRPAHQSVFDFNRAISVSHGMSPDQSKRVEICMHHPDHSILESYQMIFVLKGAVSFMEKGNPVTHGTISAQQHNLYRVSLNSTRMALNSPADEVVCINLSKHFLERYLPENHPAINRFNDERGKRRAMLSPLNMPLTPEINSIIQRLGTSPNSNFVDQLVLESKVIELLALQIAQFEQCADHTAHIQVKELVFHKMTEAREILIRDGAERLSLKALALRVGTNEFNLKRDFKAVFGNTVYGYLNQHKMEQARSLLMENDLSISEIAGVVGYKHATHFTSAFKKYFGYLPNKLKSGKLSLLIFADEFMMMLENLNAMVN